MERVSKLLLRIVGFDLLSFCIARKLSVVIERLSVHDKLGIYSLYVVSGVSLGLLTIPGESLFGLFLSDARPGNVRQSFDEMWREERVEICSRSDHSTRKYGSHCGAGQGWEEGVSHTALLS